jgi:hypothetical protein
LIFTLLILGKLAGETTVHGALEWVNWRATWSKGHGRLTNVASQMRRFCARPHEAFPLLLGALQR